MNNYGPQVEWQEFSLGMAQNGEQKNSPKIDFQM